MYVSIFENYKIVSTPPHKVDISVALNRVKNGKHKELIEKIRMTSDKAERSLLKKQLPCVVFSGYLGNGIEKTKRDRTYTSYREDASLSEHSGLCPIDLDDVGDERELKEAKELLKKTFNSIYSIFVSPSGNGLRVLFRIPADIEMHRSHYMAIIQDLEKEGFDVDSTSINEARLSFESYDPNIYINPSAEVYDDFVVIEDEVSEPIDIKKTFDKKLTDYNKLAIASRMIDSAPDGYKHSTLIKASYLMGGYIQSGIVNEEEARRMLRSRISARNVNNLQLAFSTIEDGLLNGRKKPIYEIEKIEEDFKTYISKKEYEDEERGYTFLENKEEVDRRLDFYRVNGEQEGLPTGFPDLDDHFRFKENTFNVILGHDNVGKSTMVWYLAVVASALHGWKWIVYSPENKTHRIKKMMIDFVLGTKSENVGDVKFNKAKEFIDEHIYFIRKDKEFSVFDLMEYGALLCQEDENIKGFMIDPYNSLRLDYSDKGRGLSAYEYHLKSATNMRIFSEKYCSVYLNAHSVTGARRGMLDADGILKRPRKDDIEQGGLWANRSDDFMVIHRKVKSEDEWMFTEIHMDKVKDVETGGSVTYEEPIKLKLMFFSDFVDMDGFSPLKKFRREFFGVGEQKPIPMIEPKDAFEPYNPEE